ncbi:LOG family protein [Oligoflexus tunisiensis]|uniref:LOG family protein n=1 Tax=Oligoflexus tunisiensis TaxID=708132 RepID=UPI000AC7826D|nr:LOG family protein [Oligoflexus tunisiensis]
MFKTNATCLLLAALLNPGCATLVISLAPSDCDVPAAVVPDGQIPGPAAIAKDAFCTRQMMDLHAPKGAVSIFGSARTPEDQTSYQITREFAFKWTQKYGQDYPILTGGGRGIMEAGNRGAFEAKGKSLSIGTWFTGGLERPNNYTTHGYMAASFSQRETDLIDYAAAVVVAPGGFGTEWEIFETLSKIQTKKKNPAPVVFLGGKKTWDTLLRRVEAMKAMGTISPEDDELFYVAESTDAAVSYIERALKVKR